MGKARNNIKLLICIFPVIFPVITDNKFLSVRPCNELYASDYTSLFQK